MKIRILCKREPFLDFVLDDVSPAFANALRRTMITEVPTLAVEWIDVEKNGSALYDEIIASRMGLMPLIFDPTKFNFSEDCRCEGKGCPLCQVAFVLNKTGPGIAWSGDLKSSNKNVKPTSPKFPITELLKDQAIKLDAVARLGIGQKHAKWQAANVAYQYWPEMTESGESKAVQLCPKGALKSKGKKAVLANPAKCNLCRACEQAGMKITGNPHRFLFRVESISGLKPDYIVSKAAEILVNKAEEFKKLTGKL